MSTVKLSAVVNTIATSTDQDPTKVGKKVRALIRRNFDALGTEWAGLEVKQNRDGNRYPPMPKPLADAVIAHFTR